MPPAPPASPASARRAAVLAWTAGILGCLSFIIWIASIFCTTGCMIPPPSGHFASIHAGCIALGRVDADSIGSRRRVWFSEHDPEEFNWWFSAPEYFSNRAVSIPLWSPAALGCAIGILAARRAERLRRRSRTGATPSSGFVFLHRRPVIRRTFKWALATATLLAIAAFFISGRWGIAYYTKAASSLTLFHGQALLSYSDGTNPSSTNYGRYSAATNPSGLRFGHPQRYGVIWGFGFHRNRYGWLCSLPIWLLCLCLLTLTAIPWIRDAVAARRIRAGLCPRCRYDRAGLAPDAICPECGLSPTKH